MQGRFPYKQLNSEIRSASRSTSRLPGLPPGSLARQGFPAVFFCCFWEAVYQASTKAIF